MARRLGIILATTVVALLVMTDGAWACRCMNRLINRCGCRRACCCVLVQPICCQTVAMPACCQGGEMKPVEGAGTTVAPSADKPPVPAVPAVPAPESAVPKKSDTPTEPKVEPAPEVKPPAKVEPAEVPAEKRLPSKPSDKPSDIGKIEPVAPVDPAKTPEKSTELGKIPALPKAPDKASDAPIPDAVPDTPTPKAPAKAPDPTKPQDVDPFGGNDVKTLRMWTDASGQYQVEARFVSFQDGTVRLQKANGGYVRIAYDLLCEVDRNFVLDQDRSLVAGE
jgi:hypothetical protein